MVNTIVNDTGGTTTDPDAFGLRVDGVPVLNNVTNTFSASSHMVSEIGLPRYKSGAWGGDCSPGGSITLALNKNAICTITNDDLPTLTVVKTIIR